MGENLKINIYGDSIMRGTVVDENLRYHATIGETLREFEEAFGASITNRARFGITVEKGAQLLAGDVESGLACDYALLEFGGNDCNFNWEAVNEQPEAAHQPFTPIARFEGVLRGMVEKLREADVTPVLMTLPPVDAEKYLRFICRKGNRPERILKFLGDVHMIYRFQEMYSMTAAKVARQMNTLLIDVRQRFLDVGKLGKVMGLDGIHLNREGYKAIFEAFHEYTAERLQAVKEAMPVAIAPKRPSPGIA